METPLLVLEAHYNKKNSSRCALYPDRVVLSTQSSSRLMAIYANRSRQIPLRDIEKVVISSGGMGFFARHPNAIHFIVKGSRRTLDDMLRDPKFHSSDYIDEGVQQFCPHSQQELTEQISLATRIKDYIEQEKNRDHLSPADK